jgi:hypothetical protein
MPRNRKPKILPVPTTPKPTTDITVPATTEMKGGFIGTLEASVSILNNSKYFAAMMMLLLNLGSRYISMELSQLHEDFLSNTFIRRFLVFTVVFIATRDIKVALISTAIFIVIVSGIFNEDSKYCILPMVSDPRKITKQEYHYAQSILEKYHKQLKEPETSNNNNNNNNSNSSNNNNNNSNSSNNNNNNSNSSNNTNNNSK